MTDEVKTIGCQRDLDTSSLSSSPSIGDLIQLLLDEVEAFREDEAGVKDITFEYRAHTSHYDDPYVEFYLYGRRPETQEETDARLNREQQYKENRNRERRRQYELLKKEFEGDDAQEG